LTFLVVVKCVTEFLSFYKMLLKNIIEYLKEAINMILSDWIYVLCTLCLAIVALVAPYLNDLWKRKSLAPKLKIVFHKEFPYILEPYENGSLYLLCFEVKNEGNSKAKN